MQYQLVCSRWIVTTNRNGQPIRYPAMERYTVSHGVGYSMCDDYLGQSSWCLGVMMTADLRLVPNDVDIIILSAPYTNRQEALTVLQAPLSQRVSDEQLAALKAILTSKGFDVQPITITSSTKELVMAVLARTQPTTTIAQLSLLG